MVQNCGSNHKGTVCVCGPNSLTSKDQYNDYVFYIPPKSRKQSFKLTGNVAKIHNQFDGEGKISFKLKLPDAHVFIRNADPKILPDFVVALEGVALDAEYDIGMVEFESSVLIF